VQGSSWADRLELVGDDDRLVGLVGALPLRLLAERTGLRAGLSRVMRRVQCNPVYDRGQVLIDMALILVLGGESISDFQGLGHLAPVTGPVPSTPTVWRALSEAGELQLTLLNAAVTSFRRHWWTLLAPRPEGFGVADRRWPGADRGHGGGSKRLHRVRGINWHWHTFLISRRAVTGWYRPSRRVVALKV